MPLQSITDAGQFVLVWVPIAVGLGWLLGPSVARGDRWTAVGASIAATLLGLPLGAFALAAPFVLAQASDPLQAVVGIVGFGLLSLVFYGTAGVIAAVPTTLLWAFLVQATTRRIGSPRRLHAEAKRIRETRAKEPGTVLPFEPRD